MIYILCLVIGIIIGIIYKNEKIKSLQKLIDSHDNYFNTIFNDIDDDFMDEFDELIEEE